MQKWRGNANRVLLLICSTELRSDETTCSQIGLGRFRIYFMAKPSDIPDSPLFAASPVQVDCLLVQPQQVVLAGCVVLGLMGLGWLGEQAGLNG